jgi:uncharacterized membrane protein
MERIEKSIEVHVPVRTAYDQWTQFEEFPQFMEGIEEVRQTDERHVHWVAEIGGKRMEWDSEISLQEPDRCVAWRSISGKRNDGRVEFSPLSNDATRVTVRMDYEPEGVVENVGDFLGVTSSRVEGDLERFRDFIEARGRETGAWRGEIGTGNATASSSSGAAASDASPGQEHVTSGVGMSMGSSNQRTAPASSSRHAASSGTGTGMGGGTTPGQRQTGTASTRASGIRGSDSVNPMQSTPSAGDYARHEPAFRADFDQNYASQGGRYEDYRPAYEFGCSLRQRRQGGAWNDLESEAQRDWETNRPGTWERFKSAIRRGWETITGEA